MASQVQGLPFGGQAPSWEEQLGQLLLKSVLKQGLKQGTSYLNNQFGLTDQLMNLLGLGGSPAMAGTIGGLVPELAGPIGADIGMGLGVGAGGGAVPATGSLGGIMSGLSAGGGIPVAVGAAILTNILMDELQDPKGRVSAVQDYNQQNSQTVPSFMKALGLGASVLPRLDNDLSDNDLVGMFKAARGGLKASQLMADPIANSGVKEVGVKKTNYSGLNPTIQAEAPLAWLATIKAQDMLAKKPEDIQKKAFEVPSGPKTLYGRPDEQQLMQMTPEQRQFEEVAFGPGREGGTLALKPAQALGMIGHYGGFNQQPLDIASMGLANGNPYGVYNNNGVLGYLHGTPNPQAGYLYNPDIMEQLGKIQPGNMEQGLLSILQQQPGYMNSALAGLY